MTTPMVRKNGPLREGVSAPDFTLRSDKNEDVRLRDLRGKDVVLYFYPKDNTPGCTIEAKDFNAALATFLKAGATILGVSKDSIASHCNFRDKFGLKFPLLSDPDLTAHEAYGVWGEKNMYGRKILGTIRSTFVIGKDGKILRTFSPVKVAGHVDAVLAALKGKGDTDKKVAAKGSAKGVVAKAKPAKTPTPKSTALKSKSASPAKKKSPRR